ncbi:MAG: helix-turn-helix domain-containing protein [Clostridia bacterium]|nr:helix-turn-helix domain-containing protein [Clostridia bacterium]
MDNLKLNDTICFYRKKQGLTQEELAVKLGVTNQSVSKWESAQCCPDISLIPKLADIFDVSIDELFGREPFVNDVCGQFPLRDDDIFRVVVARGKKVILVDDLDKTIDITFPKNCNETTRQYFRVEVFGNVCCDSSINGDVISHGKIECNQINGDVKKCEGDIECQGDINGSANANGSISCDKSISGGVQCGNSVACGQSINGAINCGNNVGCGVSIKGDINCGGNIECKKIEGDVECRGNIIYK